MQIHSSNDLEASLGLVRSKLDSSSLFSEKIPTVQVFDIFDCDKSAMIDRKEIVQMIIATSVLTGNSWEALDAKCLAEQIMTSCDIRRIGKITKTEFVSG